MQVRVSLAQSTGLKTEMSMTSRFEWQSAISQSAHTDETHSHVDRHFYPRVQDHFLSVNSR